MRSILFLMIFLLVPSLGAGKDAPSAEDYMRKLACRIVMINGNPPTSITPLLDTHLDTLSFESSENTFSLKLANGRKLGAMVRRVKSRLPRDRFHVELQLDGKTLARISHIDLDIYVETVIDDQRYALHCLSDLAN